MPLYTALKMTAGERGGGDDCCPNGQQTPQSDQTPSGVESGGSRHGDGNGDGDSGEASEQPLPVARSPLCGNNNKLPKMFTHLRSGGF